MDNKSPVAKLERVDLRVIWADEARDFTPWLATEEGLGLVGDEIGCRLELIKREAQVGTFSADILANVVGEEDHKVVIENQFGKTDHDHLGKIITYAAGLGAKSVVWVSDTFCEEHREALNWLNQNTGEGLVFWGLEIHAYRIEGSRPAPQFSAVSAPIATTKVLRSGVSSIKKKTKDEVMQLAANRHVGPLVTILLKLGRGGLDYLWVEPSRAYGGSFRCWRRDEDEKWKMVLGINVSGERKKTPDGQLDLWLPVPAIAAVTDSTVEAVCQKLDRLPIFAKESVDWIVRLKNDVEAENALETISRIFEEADALGTAPSAEGK